MADDERDTELSAREAYERRPRGLDDAATLLLWEAMWRESDFSWSGLTDAGWEFHHSDPTRDKATLAQRLKRWHAPLHFPGGGQIHGDGETAWKEATLQDYWRWSLGVPGFAEDATALLSDASLREAGLLLERDGVLFHAIHCQDIQLETGDPGAHALETLLKARLAVANGRNPYGPVDDRVQLAGARVRGIDRLLQAHAPSGQDGDIRMTPVALPMSVLEGFNAQKLNFGHRAFFRWVLFLDTPSFERASFGVGADFMYAAFRSDARFWETEFGDHANFIGARFSGHSSFYSVKFGSHASFSNTVFGYIASFDDCTFGPQASFYHATFLGSAGFLRSQFDEQASFSGATFEEETRFPSVQFSRSPQFQGTLFNGTAAFNDTKFGPWATFDEAVFAADARFGGAVFDDNLRFSRALFRAGATFGRTADGPATIFGKHASFMHAVFEQHATFSYATFGGEADLSNTQFRYQGDFSGARFGDGARFAAYREGGVGALDFSSAIFEGAVSFPSWTFEGTTKFDKAVFKGNALFGDNGRDAARFTGRISFRAAEFASYADFSNVTWPEKVEDQHAAFEGARFRDVADFQSQTLTAFPIFHGAAFERRLLIADPIRPQTPDLLFRAAQRQVALACARDRKAMSVKPNALMRDERVGERGAEARWQTLAGGFRTLKLAMAQQSDTEREQRFYRYELKARGRQPSVALWERAAAGLYGLSSDYGASIGRPFVALAVVLTAFAAAYWGWGLALGIIPDPADPAKAAQALEFSVTNTFRPLSALTAEGLREGTLGAELLKHDDFTALGVRALSVAQSLAAIILAFLFALAVRRRFQIA